MAFDLRYHPTVKEEDLLKLSADVHRRIANAIESRLTTAPARFGIPLRGALRDYRKLRIGDYRVVFSVRGRVVWVLAILHQKLVSSSTSMGRS